MLCYIIAMNISHHHDPQLSRNQERVILRKAKGP
jgi:hypothetical protein